MPCFHPITAWYGKEKTEKGKRSIVFREKFAAPPFLPIKLPCGRCIGCRLERSRQWAVRCMHEKKMSSFSYFVTLSYDDDHIPPGHTLVRRDLQLFMKRLRKEYGDGIRFYACGEYGDVTKRPHYHLLLFNVELDDCVLVGKAKGGQPLYASDRLRRVWSAGHNFIGECTFESCAYVARYIMKKVNGDMAQAHYEVVTNCGEVIDREPEFVVMSRRPGIGANWFDHYYPEVYAYDSVITNGHEAKPPRFYDLRFELLDKMRHDELKKARKKAATAHASDNTPQRLRVREEVARRNLQDNLKRGFE